MKPLRIETLMEAIETRLERFTRKKQARKKQGRPRSLEAKQSILNAAWLIVNSSSIKDATIEKIANAATVGKTTIYRWWQSKLEIVLEALSDREITNHRSLEQQIDFAIAYLDSSNGYILQQAIAEDLTNVSPNEKLREIIEKLKTATSLFPEGTWDRIFTRMLVDREKIDREFLDRICNGDR